MQILTALTHSIECLHRQLVLISVVISHTDIYFLCIRSQVSLYPFLSFTDIRIDLCIIIQISRRQDIVSCIHSCTEPSDRAPPGIICIRCHCKTDAVRDPAPVMVIKINILHPIFFRIRDRD